MEDDKKARVVDISHHPSSDLQTAMKIAVFFDVRSYTCCIVVTSTNYITPKKATVDFSTVVVQNTSHFSKLTIKADPSHQPMAKRTAPIPSRCVISFVHVLCLTANRSQ